MSPIYTYRCKKCKKDFDHFHLKVGEILTTCPTCKSDVEKLISKGTSFSLKGYGWPSKDIKSPPPPPSSTNKRTLKKKIKKLRDDGFQGPLTPKF